MQDIATGWIWFGFSIFVIIALSADTFLLTKNLARPHQSMRAALFWTLLWIVLALIFNGLLWFYLYFSANMPVANEVALDFLTGYLIEKTLSIDNLFAFYMIFEHLRIPINLQQRVFSLGIWSAIVLRLLVILMFSWLVVHLHWLLYIMGAFLLLTGIKMVLTRANEKDPTSGRFISWLKRHIRITHELEGQRFFIRKNQLLYATPLLLALVLIEISDLIFAFDSIPAIFAITQDPFIVWTANIFAILGLRALYFLLVGMVNRFSLLKYGVALILIFVGAKMVIAPWIAISVELSLGIIAVILLLFTWLSLWKTKQQGR